MLIENLNLSIHNPIKPNKKLKTEPSPSLRAIRYHYFLVNDFPLKPSSLLPSPAEATKPNAIRITYLSYNKNKNWVVNLSYDFSLFGIGGNLGATDISLIYTFNQKIKTNACASYLN